MPLPSVDYERRAYKWGIILACSRLGGSRTSPTGSYRFLVRHNLVGVVREPSVNNAELRDQKEQLA